MDGILPDSEGSGLEPRKIVHFTWFCEADELHREWLPIECLHPFEDEEFEEGPLAYAG